MSPLILLALLAVTTHAIAHENSTRAHGSFRAKRVNLLVDSSTMFTFTGAAQPFTVPIGVTQATIELYGASGGQTYSAAVGRKGIGGSGGMMKALIDVTPGEILNVFIGAPGGFGPATSFNGGGGGGTLADPSGSGGGASDIRRSPYSLADRLVVAGGGGGGYSYWGASGGHGGYPAGTAGTVGVGSGVTGGGGTQTAGGSAGASPGANGEFGIGASMAAQYGGGGGGGYYGGGTADDSGAGGGSSYANGTIIAHQTGVNLGVGYGFIYWSVGPSAMPTLAPTGPSALPTARPSRPTITPTRLPTAIPTRPPTVNPSTAPTRDPTAVPSAGPTVVPSAAPSASPSAEPSAGPTAPPSAAPSMPTANPTTEPSAVPTPVPTLAPYTALFTFTGAPQNFSVPTGVTEVNVELYGASGGDIKYVQSDTGREYLGIGGNGAMMRATINVTPGEMLTVYVGALGTANRVGAYNGGGAGGLYSLTGASGGGASDIRRSPYALEDRLVVAAGGGGSFAGARGGDGGYPSGIAGTMFPTSEGFPAGGGGTATGGGAAGFIVGIPEHYWYGYVYYPSNGTLGSDGSGGYYGAGGGGGYYGGGGSYQGSGGGGSSYANGTDLFSRTGMNIGDGYGMIYWSEGPSTAPSMAPSGLTIAPTIVPSRLPTIMPSNPSALPTLWPTRAPTQMPSNPSAPPTTMPSNPSVPPTARPTIRPTVMPSNPSAPPTVRPTNPSAPPTAQPTRMPTPNPTNPTAAPSANPTNPTASPTLPPSAAPSCAPTAAPSRPTAPPTTSPTAEPTIKPTPSPSIVPSVLPTATPSCNPSAGPTMLPTSQPSSRPSCQPSNQPSQQPTVQPSQQPSSQPSQQPTGEPSAQPTRCPSIQPSTQPSQQPTGQPSLRPSSHPTNQPSTLPSQQPSAQPTQQPRTRPTQQPSVQPSALPSQQPSGQPSLRPSSHPTDQPSALPSQQPSAQPTRRPSTQPTAQPSRQPSLQPSQKPSLQPTSQPSGQPTRQPSSQPSMQPQSKPSGQPSRQPSTQPSSQPASVPTGQPSSQPSSQPSRRPSAQPSAEPTVRTSGITVRATTSAPNITELFLTSDRTSITSRVRVAGSAEVTVYCAAFAYRGDLAPGALLSVNDLLLRGSRSVTSGKLAMVAVTNLAPATNYTVYCATQSFDGALLPLPAVLQTARRVETLCCRDVTVDLAVASIVQDSAAASAVTVRVSIAPETSLRVDLYFVDAGGASVNTSTVYPPSVDFLSDAAGRVSSSHTVVARTLGEQRLVAALSGPAASLYAPVYVGRSALIVLTDKQPPSVPTLLSAQFTDDGASVILKFDSATDRARYNAVFPCAELLRFAGAAAAVCNWVDSSAITIYPRYSAASVVGMLAATSPIALLPGKVRAECTSTNSTWCSTWSAVPQQEVRVATAQNPASPIVSMTAPASISGCASLLIDLTSSTGAAGRPWLNVTFTVLTSPPSSKSARVLLSFLQRNYTLSPPSPIPNNVLRAGLSYTIQARLCNFLGACGTAARTVFVSQSLALTPLVSILGPADRTVRRADELSLSGSSYTVSCAGTRSFDGIVRTWAIADITPSGGGVPATGLRSMSPNPAIFKLDPFLLRADAIYRVTVNATSLSTGQSAAASAVIRVIQGSLVTRIAGNQQRSQLIGVAFMIDASGSYDEDYPGQALTSPDFRFAWSCVQIGPVFHSQCPLNFTQPSSSLAKLSVLGGDTALGSVSRFSAILSDATRSGSAYVEITIVAAPFSELSVWSALSSLSSVDSSNNLVLFGSLKLVAPCTARWSVNEPRVNFSTAALTATTAPLQVEAKPAVFNLVIAGSTLPERSTLVFTLACGDARASLTLTTNGAPLPGLFEIDPPGGEELVTLFHFSANQWTDPDLPLTYLFGFQSETSASTLALGSRSEFTYMSSHLPAGLAGSGFRLNCTAEVFDNIGASMLAMEEITVRKGASGTIEQSAVQQLVDASAGSVDDTKRMLAVTAAVINSVNCSSAPNCTTLHREKCAFTSGACGRCVTGYVGDAGDQNTPCFPVTLMGARRRIQEQNCTNNADCEAWQVCEGRLARACIAQPKTCLGNCSGRGDCVFTSSSTGIPLPASQCRIDNPYCTATCACRNQFTGRMCELSSADVSARAATRSVLVSVLQNLTSVDDINEQSVESWSATLHSLALRPYELSAADASSVLATANTTLARARDVQVPTSQLSGILQAVDAVMSMQWSGESASSSLLSTNNTAAASVPVIDYFAQLTSQLLVLGQAPSTLIADNFRVLSALQALSADGQNVTLHTLQTDFEHTYPVPPSSIVMIPAAGAATNASAVAVDLITVFPRSYAQDTSMYDADPIYLRVRSDTGERAGAFLAGIEFTFVHYETLQRSYEPVANVTSTCQGNASTTLITEVCPGSGRVVVHNCTGITGTVESTCPQLAPSCALLSVVDADFTQLSQCVLHRYNNTATVCLCDLISPAGPGSRSLSTGSDPLLVAMDYTGVANVATISVYTGESFTSTFSAAPEFTTTDALGQVVIVLYLFGTLWGTGLLLAAVSAVRSNPRLYGLLTKKFTGNKIAKVRPAAKESDPKERFLSYIEEVVPQVYADGKRGLERLLAELCAHHRYLTLFTLGDGKLSYYSKMIIVLKVLTVDTMQMFLLAALYDLQCPDDDGSCTELFTPDTCLARKSILDSDQTFCQWKYSPAHTEYTCSYRAPSSTVWTFIYIFVIVSMVTSLFNVPTDYLFAVCTAPVEASAIGDESNRSILGRVSFTAGEIARRLSKTAAATAQPVTRRLSSMIQKARASIIGADAVIDTEGSEDLRQRHASVIQVLPGISHRARNRESSRAETASLVRAMATKRHSTMTDRTAKAQAAGRIAHPEDGEEDIRKGEFADGMMDLEAAPVVHTLYTDIIAQRLLLSDSDATRLFDAQWGMQCVPNQATTMFEVTASARESIQASIDEAERIADETKEQMPKFTTQHAGLMILHLFIQDLLGRNTPAAKIFNSKFEENYAQTKAVQPWSKGVALCSILLSNAFFVYYALLKAYVKGRTWQREYVVACVVQMVVEVLLNETLECLWLNYWVPSLVRKDVGSAVRLLKHVAEEITLNDSSAGSATRVFLDAPPYLFASTKVAMKHEKLLESVLVMSYHNHLPGELCKTWSHYEESQLRAESEAETRAQSSTLMRVQLVMLHVAITAVAFMVAMIQWSGTLSFDYQRIIIRIVQPMLFSGLTMLGYLCTSNVIGIAVFFVAVLAILLAVVWMRRREDRRAARQLLQVAPDIELDPDLEKEIEKELAVHRYLSKQRDGGDGDSSSGSSVSGKSENGEAELPTADAEDEAVLLGSGGHAGNKATELPTTDDAAEVARADSMEDQEQELASEKVSANSTEMAHSPTAEQSVIPGPPPADETTVEDTKCAEAELQDLVVIDLLAALPTESTSDNVPSTQSEAASTQLVSNEVEAAGGKGDIGAQTVVTPASSAGAAPVKQTAKATPSYAKSIRPAAATTTTPATAQEGTRRSFQPTRANLNPYTSSAKSNVRTAK